MSRSNLIGCSCHRAGLVLSVLATLFVGACASTETRSAPSLTPAGRPLDATANTIAATPPVRQLFGPQGSWLGADSAYSIALDAERVLWLFGDTFLDPKQDGSRTNGPSFFVRNTCAIQTLAQLDEHALRYYWQDRTPEPPGSFFHDFDGAQHWLWPLHGVRMPDGKLLLFRMHLAAISGGLGFSVLGWDAVAIDDPSQAPAQWSPRVLTPPTNALQKLVGSSVLIDGQYLYAYSVQNSADDHAIYLARWPLTRLAGLTPGSLADPEWWCGAAGFVAQSGAAAPVALFADGQVELSVSYQPEQRRFLEVQTRGVFLADAQTALALRWAPRPEGPFTALQAFYRPPEASRPDAAKLAVYAAKAHPEQRARGMFITYVVNDLGHPVPDDALYYPRVLELRFQASQQSQLAQP